MLNSIFVYLAFSGSITFFFLFALSLAGHANAQYVSFDPRLHRRSPPEPTLGTSGAFFNFYLNSCYSIWFGSCTAQRMQEWYWILLYGRARRRSFSFGWPFMRSVSNEVKPFPSAGLWLIKFTRISRSHSSFGYNCCSRRISFLAIVRHVDRFPPFRRLFVHFSMRTRPYRANRIPVWFNSQLRSASRWGIWHGMREGQRETERESRKGSKQVNETANPFIHSSFLSPLKRKML